MIKSNKHIEIVRTTTKELSSMSQESCDTIFAVLATHFIEVGVTVINNLSDLEALVIDRPDLVFLGMEFIPVNPALGLADPHKIWLSDFFDEHGITYTGSSQTAHMLERNKPLAKQCVLDAGLTTSAFCVIGQDQTIVSHDVPLTFPLFIKPTNRGGGHGVNSASIAYNFAQVCSKVYSITTKLHAAALIEEYLPGREFSVAILKDEYSAELLVMPIELVAPPDKDGARFLSDKVKSSNTEQVIEVTDRVIKDKLTKLAINAFSALGARDYGRIDIRLDKHGTPHFLEANLLPSLISGYGSFPKACVLNIGLDYESMIMRIANLGFARNIPDVEDIAEPIMVIDRVLSPTEVAFRPA